MKKLFLLLFMVTSFLQAQTYQNPTFGTVTTKTSPTVTNDPYVTTTGTTGVQGKIAPVNLLIPYTPTNYSVPNLTIGAHLEGIDTRLGQIDNIQFVGDIYNKTTWSNLNDFDTPTATVSIVSGKISFSGVGASDYSKTLTHNFYTNRDKSTYKITFRANEKSATSYGISVMFGRTPFKVTFDMTNGVDSGKIKLLNPASTVATSNAVAWAVGDIITMRIDRVADIITVSLSNETTPVSSIFLKYTFSHITTSMPNTSKISIAHLGGNIDITGIRYSSTELKNSTVMFVGDSKVQGYSPTYLDDSFARRGIKFFGNGVIHAGQGDQTSDVMNTMPEILAMAPKTVYLAIGSNDIRYGVSYSSYTTNYSNIVNELTSAGIKVIHLLPLYESGGLDQIPLRDYITSTYSVNDIIDTYTATLNIINGTPDGTHGNTEYHTAVYNTIVETNKTSPGKRILYATNYTTEVEAALADKARLSGTNFFSGNQSSTGQWLGTGFAPTTPGGASVGSLSNYMLNIYGVNYFATRIKAFTGANLDLTDNSNNLAIRVWNSTANVTIGGTSNAGYKLDVIGTTRMATAPIFASAPATSTDVFYLLTGNNSSNQVEKIPSTTFAPTASPTFTGTAGFYVADINSGYIGFSTNTSGVGSNRPAVFRQSDRLGLKGSITNNNPVLIDTDALSAIRTIKVQDKDGIISLTLGTFTVATLPTPTGTAFAVVTDATAPTYLGTLTGGGSIVCPVFYNGTTWVAH